MVSTYLLILYRVPELLRVSGSLSQALSADANSVSAGACRSLRIAGALEKKRRGTPARAVRWDRARS